ncbi:MAG TPA: galactose oxidase early set domain-containing protein, partial [Candidatus Eisenbacteria bacterium]|nr:galactose oxidase early set domain-containing protein [Candidatus Eisenbacteria bacterium]
TRVRPRRAACGPWCRWRARAPALALAAALLAAAPARAQNPALGKWSRALQLSGIPVHFALAPCDSGEDVSSQILWWNGGPTGDTFVGGLMFWRPPTGAMDAFANDTLTGFPTASFASRPMRGPARNIFCAGHARLPDGRLFVTGGTDSGSFGVGTKFNTLFDPHQRTWDVAAEPLPMSQRRWYGSATTLADGRLLLDSGSQYFHVHLFGGSRADSLEPPLVTRLALAENGQWDGKVSDPGGIQPEPREFLGTVPLPGSGATAYFGGRDSLATGATPRNKNDVWLLFGSSPTNAPDYGYAWSRIPAQAADSAVGVPTGRYLMGVSTGPAGEALVFGGAADVGPGLYDVRGDVWLLRPPDAQHPAYRWFLAAQDTSALAAAGLSLGPRCGQAMWRDSRSDSILVFGGAAAPDAAPTDTNVYALHVTWTGSGYTATWSVLPIAPGPSPGPRANAGSCGDPELRLFGAPLTGSSQSCGYLFGGRDAAGALHGDLWQLWLVRAGGATSAQWGEVAPPAGTGRPGPRMNAALVLEPDYDRLVLAGGDTTLARARSDAVWSLRVFAVSPGGSPAPAWQRYVPADPSPLGAVSGLSASFWPSVIMSRVAEVYDPAKSGAAATTAYPADPHLSEWYPFLYTVPDTTTPHRIVFEAAPRPDAWLLDLDAPDGTRWQPVDPPTPARPLLKGGSAVLYRVGAVSKVMKCGSRDTDANVVADSSTLSMDLTAAPSANRTALRWQGEAPMKYGRVNHNLVLLPSGDVAVFGGTRISGADEADDNTFPFVYTPELWHPRGDAAHAGAWDTLLTDPFRYRRGYHSSAFLLPDARVMSGGGNTLSERTNSEAVQVYSPPYLFAADGTVLPRPKLLASQGRATYGDVLTFATDTTLDSLVLMRAAATTHANNMEQRRIPLLRCTTCRTDSNATGYHEFTFRVPTDPAQAPPGDYLVFGLKAGFAPAIARWLRIATPRPLVDPGDLVHPARIHWRIMAGACGVYRLSWLAPADDSTFAVSGPVARLDARWSATRSLCDTCWEAFRAAEPLVATPIPAPPGTPQTMPLSELQPGFTYQVQILAEDDRRAGAPSTSPLSSPIAFHANYCDTGLYALSGAGGAGAAGAPDLLKGGISALGGLAPGEVRRELLPIAAPAAHAGRLRVRLYYGGAGGVRLLGARLVAADAADPDMVLLPGSLDPAGRPQPATRITRQDGVDVTAELAGDANPYHGFAGDTLLVTLPAPAGYAPDAPLPLRVRAAGMPPAGAGARSGFLLQMPDAAGWRTLGRFVPHDQPVDFAVDSVETRFVRLVLLTS